MSEESGKIKQLVLIVDDVPRNLQYIGTLLRKNGIDFALAENGEKGLEIAGSKNPDLILLDINLPGIDGFEVCRRLKTIQKTRNIPIIFLTAKVETESIVEGFQLGAVDYVTKPIKAAELLARVKTQLELKSYRDNLEEMVSQRTAQLENARLVTILGLAKLTEYRERHTGWHLERIREYTRLLARQMAEQEEFQAQITPEFIEEIYNSSILHDIGKVGIPDAILLKPGKLTRDEFEVIKIHTFLGGNLIQKIESRLNGESFLSMAREIAHFHHEKWDGNGYPDGLSAENIPLSARITALADVYDALISRRPYKEPFSHEKARTIILEGRATHFDPRVVDAFLACEAEFVRIMTNLQIEGDVDLIG